MRLSRIGAVVLLLRGRPLQALAPQPTLAVRRDHDKAMAFTMAAAERAPSPVCVDGGGGMFHNPQARRE